MAPRQKKPRPFCVSDWRLHRVSRNERVKRLKRKIRTMLSVCYHPANMSDKKRAVWFKTTELIASNGSNGYYFRPTDEASIYYKLTKGVNIPWKAKIEVLPENDPLRMAYDYQGRKWRNTAYELFWFIRVAHQHSNSGVEKKNDALLLASQLVKEANGYPLERVLYSDTAKRLFDMFPELHDLVFEHYELEEEKSDLIDTLKIDGSILVRHPHADVGESESEDDM